MYWIDFYNSRDKRFCRLCSLEEQQFNAKIKLLTTDKFFEKELRFIKSFLENISYTAPY